MQVVELSKILYIQAQGAYARICLDEEVNIFLCSNLCFMEEILGLHDFLRIHRSFLLNIKKVSGFDSRAGCVWINGIILPVSRRKSAKVFQELLKNGIKDGKKYYRL
jgi:DNA-binding LytR/AlgR family response regulator